ncbi:hypothetical protein [Micromonospora sp. WMMD1082]|uniref:hypothetical protein n=1 Tax=Micromonospora sp. WMMD1082 TaxID=3016104 RepID=UPI002416A166|nr:hypothetical protein [Micromonospora sp. WMMD1082]MDG4793061.1 hypothetical protein [Micromonospora sp. WMMD1082]
MGKLIAGSVGVLLLYAALIKGGASPLTWALYRRRLTRALTGFVVLLLACALLLHLTDTIGHP